MSVLRPALFASAGTVLLLACYWPGLHGPFLFDDFHTIVDAPGMDVQDLSPGRLRDAVFANQSVFPHRAVSRLSFTLSYYLAGREFDPWWFKFANLLVHFVNALLVGTLAVKLVSRVPQCSAVARVVLPTWSVVLAAVIATMVWALHPIHVSSVLYVVQRMASLAATFSLVGLLTFLHGRERLERGRSGAMIWMAAGIGGGVLAGLLCKENVVVVPLLALLIEVQFFRSILTDAAQRSALRRFYIACVGIPAAVGLTTLIAQWEWFQQAYEYRSFTMDDRLLTQARMLWLYASLLILPFPTRFSLFRDDVVASTGWLTPWTTLPSVTLWILAISLSVIRLRRGCMPSFALLWFILAHLVESSIIGLELAFEHRNYVPSIGATFLVAVWLARGIHRYGPSRLATFAGAVVLLFSISTFSLSWVWRSETTFAEFSLHHHPDSARARRYWVMAFAHRGAPEAEIFGQLQAAAALDPGDVIALYGMARLANRHRSGDADGYDTPLPEMEGVPPAALRWSTDHRHASALYSALDTEIRRRARESIPGLDAVRLGDDLEACMASSDSICRRMMSEGLEWLALLSESRLPPTPRAKLALTEARIRLALGDIDGAKTASLRAVGALPDFMGVWLESGSLHLRVRDLGAAKCLLDEAKRRRHWSGYGDRLLDLAYSHLARHRVIPKVDCPVIDRPTSAGLSIR